MQGSTGWAQTEQEVAGAGSCDQSYGSGTQPGLHHPERQGTQPNLQVKATNSREIPLTVRGHKAPAGGPRQCLLRLHMS